MFNDISFSQVISDQWFSQFTFCQFLVSANFVPLEKVFMPYLEKYGVKMTRYDLIKAVQKIIRGQGVERGGVSVYEHVGGRSELPC